MITIGQTKELLESVTYKYENGELTKEEYLELIQDIDTSKFVAKTAEEVEELAALNSILNATIAGLSLVV